MRNVVLIYTLTMLVLSCSSLQTLEKAELEAYKHIKRFNKNDFRIYVFNLCEKYSDDVETIERFCECPDNFYDVAIEDEVKKIEELYILIHRKTDLVLYLTTKSHKYIHEGLRGFLNDPERYENNIALEQIESIYIGRYDLSNHLIHFPSYKDEKDIILHFNESAFPQQIIFDKANVATAENDYDISEPISLATVFKEQIVYKLRNNYTIRHQQKGIIKHVESIYISSKKGVVNVSFGFGDYEGYYRLKSEKVKYHPNFSLIQTH